MSYFDEDPQVTAWWNSDEKTIRVRDWPGSGRETWIVEINGLTQKMTIEWGPDSEGEGSPTKNP